MIELLVVISIIGLLASIILVSLSGARENARIAALKEFSASIYHTLGANIIGYWKFDNNLNDSGGSNLTLTNNGGAPTYTSGEIDKQYVTFNNNYFTANSYKLDSQSGAITIEFWEKTTDSLVGIPRLLITGGSVPFSFTIFFDNTDGVRILTATFSSYSYTQFVQATENMVSFNDGKWHHIAATYDGKGTAYVYIDAKQGSKYNNSNAGSLDKTGALQIGYMVGGAYAYYVGSLDELRIYDVALSLVQVEQRYAEGLYKLQLADLTGNSLLNQ